MPENNLLPLHTMFHKRGDFVALLTDVDMERQRVRVNYWKWLPYDLPDNAISGMNGWYRFDEMLPYEVSPTHHIFARYGLPPGYQGREALFMAQVKTNVEALVRDITYESRMDRDEAPPTKILVDYVLGLLK